MSLEEALGSWKRAKLSRQKKRAAPRLVVPDFLPGQLVLPKPSKGQIARENEDDAARKIAELWKGVRE